MHGYRNGDPIWLAIMQEFGILAIQPEDERELSIWKMRAENETLLFCPNPALPKKEIEKHGCHS
jgi:hypothetical protein